MQVDPLDFGYLIALVCFCFFAFQFCCRRDHARAVEILTKDLKVFSTFNEDLFKEITLLLTLGNFRYNDFYGELFRRMMITVMILII